MMDVRLGQIQFHSHLLLGTFWGVAGGGGIMGGRCCISTHTQEGGEEVDANCILGTPAVQRRRRMEGIRVLGLKTTPV